MHNADRGRVPVLIYAGAAPFTFEGELKGARNEFIFGLQGLSVRLFTMTAYHIIYVTCYAYRCSGSTCNRSSIHATHCSNQQW